jgi:hypothetical protein
MTPLGATFPEAVFGNTKTSFAAVFATKIDAAKETGGLLALPVPCEEGGGGRGVVRFGPPPEHAAKISNVEIEKMSRATRICPPLIDAIGNATIVSRAFVAGMVLSALCFWDFWENKNASDSTKDFFLAFGYKNFAVPA